MSMHFQSLIYSDFRSLCKQTLHCQIIVCSILGIKYGCSISLSQFAIIVLIVIIKLLLKMSHTIFAHETQFSQLTDCEKYVLQNFRQLFAELDWNWTIWANQCNRP